ncbi:MAG: YggS family pyridoxal phosphate-dependent enzyme [Clostridiales bacterium]|nr:YggS family pyridoxal phosphate-dependent enzyme [Clostridiales bacterium]
MGENTNSKAFDYIKENLKIINENIAQASQVAGRDMNDIRLMAVTKNIEAEKINFVLDQGVSLIGENRVQEFVAKYDQIDFNKCKAHFIGHLQTNKVRQIVGRVDMIQSVDSLKIAKEIGKRSLNHSKNTKILLEVNIGGEASKFGFAPEELIEKVYEISEIQGLEISGLMSLVPISENKKELRKYFSDLNRLFIDISSKKIDNVSMEILSMGMSGDYYEAILEGSNLIRVGSSIFAKREN